MRICVKVFVRANFFFGSQTVLCHEINYERENKSKDEAVYFYPNVALCYIARAIESEFLSFFFFLEFITSNANTRKWKISAYANLLFTVQVSTKLIVFLARAYGE